MRKLSLGFMGYERFMGYSFKRGEIKCAVCHRVVPNSKHFTNDGCIYCDVKYHQKEKKDGKK